MFNKAISIARKEGPLYRNETYRYRGHSMSDAQKGDKIEVEEYKRYPITQVKKIIVDKKYLNDKKSPPLRKELESKFLSVKIC